MIKFLHGHPDVLDYEKIPSAADTKKSKNDRLRAIDRLLEFACYLGFHEDDSDPYFSNRNIVEKLLSHYSKIDPAYSDPKSNKNVDSELRRAKRKVEKKGEVKYLRMGEQAPRSIKKYLEMFEESK